MGCLFQTTERMFCSLEYPFRCSEQTFMLGENIILDILRSQ